MKPVLAAGIALTLLVGGGAYAANTPSTTAAPETPAMSATPSMSATPANQATAAAASADNQLQNMNIRKQLQDQLAKAGYTSVKIMPTSFFVEAKDKQGNPVQILIGPDSFTEIAALAPNVANGTGQPTPQVNSQK